MFATRGMASRIYPKYTLSRVFTRYAPSRTCSQQTQRFYSQQLKSPAQKSNQRDTLYYIGTIFTTFLGLAYLAVPLYKLLCSQTGIDGTPKTSLINSKFDPKSMVPIENSHGGRKIRVTFDSSLADTMKWTFTPEQKSLMVVPGK